MRTRVLTRFGREFVEISGEGHGESTVDEDIRGLFHRIATELNTLDLSLDHTVRTRLWARNRDIRIQASKARSRILTGNAIASSSSYISSGHLDSNADVALDLLAMRPATTAVKKKPVQFSPPRAYLRYLGFDSLVFVSGFTASEGGLEAQVPRVLADIEETLSAAGTGWDKAVKVSGYLHRSQQPGTLMALFRKAKKLEASLLDIGFVDGFAGEKSLLEVEVTATV